MLKTFALDDPRSLQTAVAEALASLRSPLTNPKRAAVILYGLNLANNLSKSISAAASRLRPESEAEQESSATHDPEQPAP